MPLNRSSSFNIGSKFRRSLSFNRTSSFHRTRSFHRTHNFHRTRSFHRTHNFHRTRIFRRSSKSPQSAQTPRRWKRPSNPPSTSPQWLDHLPLEVCERIAVHLSSGFPTRDLLHFAQTSPKLADAVVRILEHKLAFKSSCPDDVMRGFVNIIQQHVFEIDITHVRSRYVACLLHAPGLQVASICDWRPQLAAASVPISLHHLHLRIEALVPRKLVLRTLSSLPLTKLSIVCHHNRPSRCPFLKPHAFARACRSLLSLSARCKCHPQDPAPWRVIPYLDTLEELEIFDDVPMRKRWFPQIAMLKSVKLTGRNAYAIAATLGQVVTELNLIVGGEILGAQGLTHLHGCQLNVLRVRLKLHAEASLAQYCRQASALRVLELQWNPGRQGGARCKYYGVRYAEAFRGELPRAVAMLPALEELKMMCVRVSLCELTDIMRSVGPRLRVFGTSIADQAQAPFARLFEIIKVATECNTELREFIVSESFPVFPFGAFVLVGRSESLRRLTEEGRRIEAAVRRLKTRAPYLDCRSLNSITRLLVDDRYQLISDNDHVRVDPITRW